MTTPNAKTLRRRLAVLLAGLALLCGCAGEQQAERDTPVPDTPELPTQTESAPALPLTEPTPEELLAQQPVDEDHDAFLVDTGGRLGTLLVTVEREEGAGQELEDFLHFNVWDPAHIDAPIQRMEMESAAFHRHSEEDANFDGHTDFTYSYALGVQVELARLWLWNEEMGQFEEEPEYADIPSPQVDPETKTISGWSRSSVASDGVNTFHHWEDRKLVCVRRITSDALRERVTLLVEDRMDGELKEVFYQEYSWEEIEHEAEEMELWWQERSKWMDLSYHGEP